MSVPDAAIAMHRFGLGARPGDLDRIASDPREALAAELESPDLTLITADLAPTHEVLAALRERRRARKQAKAAGMGRPADTTRAYAFIRDEVTARIDRVLAAEIGFGERLTTFWANHFAVGPGNPVQFLSGAYEREAIRSHVLGRFSDMLLAATRHPAMLFYLNNARSIGPNSRVGKRRERGLNENHAREILELHTVGVDGGYSQEDVTAFARALTGWTVRPAEDGDEQGGGFFFNERAHEPGDQTVLGVTYPDEGVAQAEAILADLARHPATAKRIAHKLAKHFVADTPPEGLVNRLEGTFLDTEGDLKEIALALIDDDEAWGDRSKLKSPQEFLWGAIRALGVEVHFRDVRESLAVLGQPLWRPPSPEGYKDDVAAWLAPDGLTDRLDLASTLAQQYQGGSSPVELIDAVLGSRVSEETRRAVERAESPTQGVSLLLMSPEFQRR